MMSKLKMSDIDSHQWLDLELDKELCAIYYYIVYKNDGDLLYIGQVFREERRKLYYRHCGHLRGKQHVDKLLKTHRYSYGILWIGFIEDVDAMEDYFIKIFCTISPYGLNHQSGGHKNKKFSEDVLKKMSDKQKGEKSWRWGLKASHETRMKQSKSLKGKKHSEEFKRKMSEMSPKSKGVVKFSIKDGTKLEEYRSINIASKKNNISRIHITQCCNGVSYRAGDYIWRWKDDCENVDKIEVVLSPFEVKKIGKYDTNGNLLETYDGLRMAAKSVNGSTGAICDVCNGKHKTSKGFVWKYVYD